MPAESASRGEEVLAGARGDDSASSDVDFLVDLEPTRTRLDLGGLVMDLQDLLQRDVAVVL